MVNPPALSDPCSGPAIPLYLDEGWAQLSQALWQARVWDHTLMPTSSIRPAFLHPCSGPAHPYCLGKGWDQLSCIRVTTDTIIWWPGRDRCSSVRYSDINMASEGQPRPRRSTWSLVVTPAADMDTDPCCRRAMESDMTLSGSTSPDITMTSGGSEGLSHQVCMSS